MELALGGWLCKGQVLTDLGCWWLALRPVAEGWRGDWRPWNSLYGTVCCILINKVLVHFFLSICERGVHSGRL